jgi:rhamnosyltransferase
MISIVIRTKNEREYVTEVLSAVYAQDDEEIFEVLIIDSGSIDGTQDAVRTFPVHLVEIPAERFSFGYALNLGAQLAHGRIVVYISAHCTPTTHRWLRNLVEPLRSDPALVASYGRQEPRNGVNPFEEPGLHLAFPADRSQQPLALFSNANCAARRTALLRNPFDETLTSSEDLVWRLTFQPDEIIYVPEASVYHSHPINFRYWAQRFERDGMATMVMQRRYGIINPYLGRNDTFALAARDFFRSCCGRSFFFLLKGHFRFIPLVPFFEAVRVWSMARGLRRGKATKLSTSSGL